MISRVEAQVPPAGAWAAVARYGRRHAAQIGTVAVGLVVWLIFVVGAPGTFLSYNIYQAFMSTTPFFAIMALPLTMVVIAGEIDLSFPSVMALGTAAFSFALVYTNSLALASVACGLAGILAGLVNGGIVAGLGIPSLVATIGTQFFWRGVVLSPPAATASRWCRPGGPPSTARWSDAWQARSRRRCSGPCSSPSSSPFF